MTYAEKLLSPKWQRKRLLIFSRDNWRCVKCGDADSTLHIHHRYYIKGRAPHEYPDSALQTLCDGCHSQQHESDHLNRPYESVKHKRQEEGIERLASSFIRYINDPAYREAVELRYNIAINSNNINSAA